MNMLEVQRNDQAEKEKTRSELMFLKAQMNPHVLFNSINSIYALIIRDPKLAANTLVKFSDMLRYQLYECNVDEVPISKEIAYLSHYIDFEKMRKNRLIVNFNVSESCANFQLAPLLMIPFVENAFKFVSDHFEHPNSIDIELDLQGKTFIFLVKNTTQSEYKIAQELKVGGIGLTNVKRRLALIYSGLHELSIKSEHEEFEIKLQIIIKT